LAAFTGNSGAVKRRILRALSSGAADMLEDRIEGAADSRFF
jgi:hypothetical protein